MQSLNSNYLFLNASDIEKNALLNFVKEEIYPFKENQYPNFFKMNDIKLVIHEYLNKKKFEFSVRSNFDHNYKITCQKNKYGVCVQLGNIGSFGLDIHKLNDCFRFNIIEKAVVIIPDNSLIKKMKSGNNASLERISEKKMYWSRQFLMPTLILGIGIIDQ